MARGRDLDCVSVERGGGGVGGCFACGGVQDCWAGRLLWILGLGVEGLGWVGCGCGCRGDGGWSAAVRAGEGLVRGWEYGGGRTGGMRKRGGKGEGEGGYF